MWGWGREGKVCVFKNNMLFLDFVAEGPAGCWDEPALQPGASYVVRLSFHTAFVPSPWLPPPREDIRGDSSCFPAFAALAFLNAIWLFLWAQWKDASGERKYLMLQQFFFFLSKKEKAIELGNPGPGVLSSWCGSGNIVPSLSISSVGQISNMGTIWLPSIS